MCLTVKESRINLFYMEIYQNNQSIIEAKTFLKREEHTNK